MAVRFYRGCLVGFVLGLLVGGLSVFWTTRTPATTVTAEVPVPKSYSYWGYGGMQLGVMEYSLTNATHALIVACNSNYGLDDPLADMGHSITLYPLDAQGSPDVRHDRKDLKFVVNGDSEFSVGDPNINSDRLEWNRMMDAFAHAQQLEVRDRRGNTLTTFYVPLKNLQKKWGEEHFGCTYD